MSVSPEVLKKIKKVAFYSYEPHVQDVLWAKPVGDGVYEFYVYYNGTWNIVTEEEGITINISDVTGDLSTFNNDAGFITEADIEDVIEGASAGSTALQPSDIASWAKQSSKPSYTPSEVGALPDTTKYAGSQSAGGAANKAVSIPFGQVDSTSTANAFTATVDGITELRDGVCCYLRNGVINSANGCTLDINELGAKPIYYSFTGQSITSHFQVTSNMLFVYNTSIVNSGCWILSAGYDSNSNDVAWIMRRSGGTYKAKEALNPNQILFTYSDNELLPTSRTRATTPTKELTTLDFDPFGAIYMSNNSAVVAQGADLDNAYIWLQRPLDIRYAFNVGTLTSNKAVYVKCSPLANGRVVLATDTQIYQELPTTEDGYVYIYLGMMQTGNLMQFTLNHPIYYYKNGAIRQWTNQDTTALKLGTSTVGDTTQGIYLNQGVPAACESYDMWYMKHIAALYGATRNDATGLWSYYYINCARWDDDNEQIVWDRNIGYDDITDAEMSSMIDNRIFSLQGVYGFGAAIQSRIAFHVRGYGNNTVSAPIYVYLNNLTLQTFGYIGKGTQGDGRFYVAYSLRDVGTAPNVKVKHIIGQCNYNGDQSAANANVLKNLEYITMAPRKNNHIFDFGYLPKLEFVSVMYTVTHNEGLQWSGCTLILHPDVYAKIFDSTNADYALWHKIDLANQARTNPITIQSA